MTHLLSILGKYVVVVATVLVTIPAVAALVTRTYGPASLFFIALAFSGWSVIGFGNWEKHK